MPTKTLKPFSSEVLNESVKMIAGCVEERTTPAVGSVAQPLYEGTRYIVGTGATGSWAGQDTKIAEATSTSTSGEPTWDYIIPENKAVTCWRVGASGGGYVAGDLAYYQYINGSWSLLPFTKRLTKLDATNFFVYQTVTYRPFADTTIYRAGSGDASIKIKNDFLTSSSAGTRITIINKAINEAKRTIITVTAGEVDQETNFIYSLSFDDKIVLEYDGRGNWNVITELSNSDVDNVVVDSATLPTTDGLYAFIGTPSGGFPTDTNGRTLAIGDIAQYYTSTSDWITLREYASAPNIILNLGDNNTYVKGSNTWQNFDLSSKQDTLVNQVNIKSINGNSLLGSGDLAVAGGTTAESAEPIFGDTIMFQDVNNLIAQASIFTPSPTSSLLFYQGRNILDMPFENNPNGTEGHILQVPVGYSNVWVRVLGDRESIVYLDKFNGSTYDSVDRRQHYRASGQVRHISPTGVAGQPTYSRDFHISWLMLTCPDDLGGQYKIRFANDNPSPVINSSSLGDGRWISGLSITKNNKGFAFSTSLEMHWRSQGNVTPLLNGAVWGANPTFVNFDSVSGLIYLSANNISVDFSLPQIPNGKDKLFFLVSFQDVAYSTPIDCLINNVSVQQVDQLGLGENFIQYLNMNNSAVYDIYAQITKATTSLIGFKIPNSIIGNSPYSHCRLDFTGAEGITYFCDCGTIDI